MSTTAEIPVFSFCARHYDNLVSLPLALRRRREKKSSQIEGQYGKESRCQPHLLLGRPVAGPITRN